MAVKVALQNDTRAGTKAGWVEHSEAAGFTVVDGCLLLWKNKGRNDQPAYVAYGAGNWITAAIVGEVEDQAI